MFRTARSPVALANPCPRCRVAAGPVRVTPATFAIPGDIQTRTGGYIYERRLLEGLRALGRAVDHLALPGSFPDPTAADMAEALARLAAAPADRPLILDGFLSGTLETSALARLRAPLCAVVHHPLGLESGLSEQRTAFLLERERANLALIDEVLVPSAHTAETLVAEFDVSRTKVTVAPPGFDPASGPPQPATPPLILSVGILHPRKGHDVLLEALSRIADLEWQAAIAGGTHDAAYSDSLRARAAEPDLRRRVRVTGELDEVALQTLYRSASVMALATRYEGYGMVFGEAQRHGLPIVSCCAGAVPDTVPAAAGLLVPPNDPVAFADALRGVLTDAELRQRLAAGSADAGRALPTWRETAQVAGPVLDRMVAGA